jgi:hypothetical protein
MKAGYPASVNDPRFPNGKRGNSRFTAGEKIEAELVFF